MWLLEFLFLFRSKLGTILLAAVILFVLHGVLTFIALCMAGGHIQ